MSPVAGQQDALLRSHRLKSKHYLQCSFKAQGLSKTHWWSSLPPCDWSLDVCAGFVLFFFFLVVIHDALSPFSISSSEHSCLLPPPRPARAHLSEFFWHQLEKIISLEDRVATKSRHANNFHILLSTDFRL